MRRVAALLGVLCLAIAVGWSASADEATPTPADYEATISGLQTEVANGEASPQASPQAVAFAWYGSGDGVLIPPVDVGIGAYSVAFTCDRVDIVAGAVIQEISGQSTYFDLRVDEGSTETAGFLRMKQPARLSGEVRCRGTWTITATAIA